MLKGEKIQVFYGENAAVSDVSFSFAAGEIVGILGPNGAGKSTLFQAVSGQLQPDSGRILFQDTDIYEHNLWFKQRLGYVHETPFLYPNLTAREFMQLLGSIKACKPEDLPGQIDSLLGQLMLAEHASKLTSELSLGMKKKLAIGCAFLNSPAVVFLDEALNGVDFESAFHIKRMLQEYAADGGLVLLSSHVLEVLQKVCNRFLILKGGVVLRDIAASAVAADQDLEKYVLQALGIDSTSDEV